MKSISNEELALQYQNGNELAFEELYNRFKKLMNKFIYKHLRYGYLEKDELSSLCEIGLYKAIVSYTTDKTVKLSTMIYRYIQTAIHHKYDYLKRNGRNELRKNSISINITIESSHGEIPLYDILNYDNSEDVYFGNNFTYLNSALEYALSNLKNNEVKKYIIPILIGEYGVSEVGNIIGKHRNSICNYINQFKIHINEYLHKNNIELEI